jgi:hypothetical protein
MSNHADVQAIVRYDGKVTLRVFKGGERIASFKTEHNIFTRITSDKDFWAEVRDTAKELLKREKLILKDFQFPT